MQCHRVFSQISARCVDHAHAFRDYRITPNAAFTISSLPLHTQEPAYLEHGKKLHRASIIVDVYGFTAHCIAACMQSEPEKKADAAACGPLQESPLAVSAICAMIHLRASTHPIASNVNRAFPQIP